jgi:hypothetical protein
VILRVHIVWAELKLDRLPDEFAYVSSGCGNRDISPVDIIVRLFIAVKLRAHTLVTTSVFFLRATQSVPCKQFFAQFAYKGVPPCLRLAP